MKIDKIPDAIDPTLNLEQIRQECLELVKNVLTYHRRGGRNSNSFFDVVIDIGILSHYCRKLTIVLV